MTTRTDVPVFRIFLAFLLVGAVSFGGGVVTHLRASLVLKRRWIDDETFVEMLAVGQTLPGLNATNIAILIGDRLHGTLGALAALLGVCLPGTVIIYFAGIGYRINGERPLLLAGLEGVAAAALGLILATTMQLGVKSLTRLSDLAFVLITILTVNRAHVPAPLVLMVVGVLAILWYRPRKTLEGSAP